MARGKDIRQKLLIMKEAALILTYVCQIAQFNGFRWFNFR